MKYGSVENQGLLIESNINKAPSESKCSTKNILIIVGVLTLVLILALILAFAIDWSSDDDQQPSRSNEYWEDEFLKEPSNESCFEISSELASEPHVAGTDAQFETGYYVQQQFDSFGVDYRVQNWSDTVLSHFVSSSINYQNLDVNLNWIPMVIHEQIMESDPDTDNDYRKHIWSAYSPSGNVTANIIYVNFGRRQDYEFLIQNENYTIDAQSFEGKIGFVRFGEGGRSGKVKMAQEYGLIGLIIFSDPEQYAPDLTRVYPNGPYLPQSGVQRGSINYGSCPGNPETNRLRILCGINDTDEAIPVIPVIPMSRENAKLLFDNMNDIDAEDAPDSWIGLMETDYKITSVNLTVNLNITNELRTDDVIQNIYGYIEGDKYKDQIIMIGAHRDSWVYGAQDDVSGTTTVLEVAKGFGNLHKRGWKPKRTIVFASWDGEESGLIGSCNFGESDDEDDVEWLNGLVAYLNLDMTTGADVFGVSGNPLLRAISEEAMQKTPYYNQDDIINGGNDTDLTFYDIWSGSWNTLGQGSDHTVFAFHLGIAAMDFGFGGDGSFGSYHSIYDTITWQETVDPNWKFAENIAKYTGILTMKLLDAEIIPFDISIFSGTIREWFDNNLIPASIEYDCNPNNITTDLLDELSDKITQLTTNADTLNDMIMNAVNDINENEGNIDDEVIEEYNDILSVISKIFTTEGGIPGRTWHKNILWNTAFESSGFNYFPYIWYALQYECNAEFIQEAFTVTMDAIENGNDLIMDYLANVTSIQQRT